MVVFFGGTSVAGKVGVQCRAPLILATGRFWLASLLRSPWLRVRGAPVVRPTVRDLPLVLALGATGVAGYNIVFLYGLTLAPASDGAIMVPGLIPVLTAALAWRLLGERIGTRAIGGMVSGFLGLLLVLRPVGGADGGRVLGDLLFLLAAGFWVAYSLIGKPATARFGTTAATLYATVGGTLLLLPLAVLDGRWRSLSTAPPESWLALLYLAVLGTVVAFVFFYEGVERIGASRASAFVFLVPLVGVLGSVALLGERLAPATLLGGALVLLGLWLVQSGRGSGAGGGGRGT